MCRARTQQNAGLTFYADQNGVRPAFTYGMTGWDGNWRINIEDFDYGGQRENAAYGFDSAYLKVEITEKGASDDYRFFYKHNSSDAWTQLGGANHVFTTNAANARTGLWYKTGGSKPGAAFDDLKLVGATPWTVTTSTLAGSAGNSAGETITLTLTFDGTVNGLSSGANSTIFTVGGTGVPAVWSGTGNTRTLAYTITAGQNGQAAIDEVALKTALIAGITDAAGNAFTYNGNIPYIDASPLPVVDTTLPSATLTTGASSNTGNATVQSGETGTAYLVKTGGVSPVTVTGLASITGADGGKWNSVAIGTANTATTLSLAGLEDGIYSLYTVDAAGNLSTAASTTYTVDSTAPTLGSTAPTIALGTAIASTSGNSTGETINLTLTFDGTVSGLSSGTNSTIFTVGGSGVSATWSGSGNTRTLTYTITAGQNGQAAIDEAALKSALIAGITDAAGNAFGYSGSIPNIDASALPVVDTRFDAAKDFIAGPTAQSAINIWQYFSADFASSNLSNLAHLSDWDTNGNGLIALNQWDGNWTEANYPFVQKQTNGTLIIHPDRPDGGTGKAVVVAWKNTTASAVTVDLTGSLSLVGDTLMSFGASSQTASADGITYLVTTSASVGSTPSVLLQGSLDENSGTATPSNTALSLGGQVLAPGAMISVAVHGGPTYFWDHTQLDLQITPRPATIDLGSHGQLIAPVQVEGKWYYYWDRDKDGSAFNGAGTTADPGDWTSHDVLDQLFNKDIAGVTNTTIANLDGQYGTTDTYRYGTINGVRLALPTLNGEGGVSAGVAAGTAFQAPWPGTAYTDAGATSNGTTGPYGDFTAIWDAYNGTGVSGIPPGWPTSDGPWTATPGGSGHLVGALHNGGVWGGSSDAYASFYVALQVL